MSDDATVTPADVYAAEAEACRLEALCEEADNHAKRLRQEFWAQVRHVRELVRAMGERGRVEQRDLFTGVSE